MCAADLASAVPITIRTLFPPWAQVTPPRETRFTILPMSSSPIRRPSMLLAASTNFRRSSGSGAALMPPGAQMLPTKLSSLPRGEIAAPAEEPYDAAGGALLPPAADPPTAADAPTKGPKLPCTFPVPSSPENGCLTEGCADRLPNSA